ncbi:MAG: PilW family protein [Burkholderiales bacterium]|nr:PilW family protein [Burkholderiales bacterium]
MYAPEAPSRRARRHGPARGLSIVELMIGIVVALLVGLAAAGSAIVFTAAQRQGIGTGGVATGNVNLISEIRNDAALAGLGFFGDNVLMCDSLNLSLDTTLVADGVPFAPLQVTRAGTNDQLDVVYGTQVHSGAHVLLNAASDGTSAELMSLLPVAPGQAVLLAPAVAGDPCTVRTVTAVTPSTDEAPQVLTFAAAGEHNEVAFGTPVVYPERSRVALLGQMRWHRYRLIGTDLTLERPMEGGAAVLARNVLAFRVQYGITDGTPGSTTVASWQDAEGVDFAALDAATIGRVRAVRIGLVGRSPQREKPDASGNCSASEAKPLLFGATVEPDVADWQCWRYRVATTVLPMRNVVMGIK